MTNRLRVVSSRRGASIIHRLRPFLTIAVLYLVVMFFGHLLDHLILFPTSAPIDAGAAVRKMVPFQSGELEIWTAQSRRAQQQGDADISIVRFCGNADRAASWAADLAEIRRPGALEL